jgi:hypothetical protein
MVFTYNSQLHSSELRLLKPVVVGHDHLRFRLFTVSRTLAPSYTAVSYTWGDGPASEVIYLNDEPFPVRLNLWSCLHYVGKDWSLLWVDAICIDQANEAEKGVQVRLMDQTYRDATCVSVWLGLIPLPEPWLLSAPIEGPVRTLESDSFDWRVCLSDLANRPYWNRLWVIQEFLLGKHVILHCSNSKMHWQDFQEMLCQEADIDVHRADHGNNIRQDVATSFRALPLVIGRRVDKHPAFLQPLSELLVNHHKAVCKDPRDRIFAMLGLVLREERALLSRFFPDYSMSEEHVLIITVAHLTQYSYLIRGDRVGEDSEAISIGLGVESKGRRRKLLRRARDFDYLGDWPPGAATSSLEFHESFKDYESEESFDNHRNGYGCDQLCPRIATCRSGWGKVILVVALGFASSWYFLGWEGLVRAWDAFLDKLRGVADSLRLMT